VDILVGDFFQNSKVKIEETRNRKVMRLKFPKFSVEKMDLIWLRGFSL